MNPNGPNQATQSPIVTGTSVVAIKYKDGVVIAADNLGMPAPPCSSSAPSR
jgi:20S proteasome subunit beta 7